MLVEEMDGVYIDKREREINEKQKRTDFPNRCLVSA